MILELAEEYLGHGEFREERSECEQGTETHWRQARCELRPKVRALP